MKSQLQNQEILSNVPAAGLPGAESSRIAAAISRILLVHRATSGSAAPGGLPTDRDESPAERRRDATPVEWALRMMF
jgi:hypothetical protein